MCQTNEKLEGGADPAVWRIAVVGGGPAGLSFCLQLFDKLQLLSALNGRRLQIGLFEKSSQIGPGLVYAKSGSFGHTHLLNVPRDGMTAFAGRFGQFSRWIREMAGERKEQWPEGVEQELFPPRHIFGEFLAHLGEKLCEKVADHPNIQIHFETMTRVENIERRRGKGPGQLEEFMLELARPGGREEEWIADQVILCSGHLPEDTFQQLIGRPGYVHDWATRKRAFQGMSPQDSVAIAGTKLSAVDICLELRARGHLGPVLMCSRTGLLPAVFVPLPLLAKREGNGQGQSEGEEYWQPYGLGMERREKASALCGGDGIILAKNLHGHESINELLFWQKQGKMDGQVNKDGQRRIGCIELTSKKLRKDSSGGTEEGNGGIPWNIPMLAPGHVFGQVVRKLLEKGQEEAQIMQNVAEAMFAEIVKLEGPNCEWAKLGRAKEKLLGMGPRQWLDWQLSASRGGQPPSWQLVIFALYPMLPAIWQCLPHSEKQIFYKHFYSLFQSFSAAMPAQNALKVREMLAMGQLLILSDLEPIEWDEGAGEFHLKGQMKEENGKVPVTVHKVKWLFNATGPGFSPMNVPLLARLVHNGMAQENAFGGFHIDPQTFRVLPKKVGQTNGGDGQKGFQKMNGLFAIGELTKGDFLLTSEMNKVAEQAEKLAKMVADVMMMARAE